LRTTFIALMLIVTALGLAQFAVTDQSLPCFKVPSLYQRLCEWLREGRQKPLSQVLPTRDMERFAQFSFSMAVLGLMLVSSIRAQRPLRLRLHVRTLMVVVAILPFGYLGGRQVWVMWQRWDAFHQKYHLCLLMEEWARMEHPGETPGVAAMRRKAAMEYGLESEKYQRAVWSPRFWFNLVSETPEP